MSHNPTPRERRLRNVGGVRRHRFPKQTDLLLVHPLMQAPKPVPYRALVEGAVILARVPFEEVDEDKVRPVVLVAVTGFTVTVKPCTTSAAARRIRGTHVELVDLEVAGLCRATFVSRRTMDLDRTALIEVQGRLSDRDRAAVLGWRPMGPVAA